MSPAFCGVSTHQACPVLAFSATMAGDVGMVTPSVSLVVLALVATEVVVEVAVVGLPASAVGVSEPPEVAS